MWAARRERHIRSPAAAGAGHLGEDHSHSQVVEVGEAVVSRQSAARVAGGISGDDIHRIHTAAVEVVGRSRRHNRRCIDRGGDCGDESQQAERSLTIAAGVHHVPILLLLLLLRGRRSVASVVLTPAMVALAGIIRHWSVACGTRLGGSAVEDGSRATGADEGDGTKARAGR